MTTDLYSKDLIEVGDLVRQQREKISKTQFELAEMSGLGEKSISRHELGTSNMKLATFFMLADALGVTPNELSPRRFLQNHGGSEIEKIEQKFNLLNDKQKKMASAMMESIIDQILEYS